MSHLSASVPFCAPSSHCSPGSSFPFPHVTSGTNALQSAVHDPGLPLSTPSSQTSPKAPSTALSPQYGAGVQWLVHLPVPVATVRCEDAARAARPVRAVVLAVVALLGWGLDPVPAAWTQRAVGVTAVVAAEV